jgi:hypothetical protein
VGHVWAAPLCPCAYLFACPPCPPPHPLPNKVWLVCGPVGGAQVWTSAQRARAAEAARAASADAADAKDLVSVVTGHLREQGLLGVGATGGGTPALAPAPANTTAPSIDPSKRIKPAVRPPQWVRRAGKGRGGGDSGEQVRKCTTTPVPLCRCPAVSLCLPRPSTPYSPPLCDRVSTHPPPPPGVPRPWLAS